MQSSSRKQMGRPKRIDIDLSAGSGTECHVSNVSKEADEAPETEHIRDKEIVATTHRQTATRKHGAGSRIR